MKCQRLNQVNWSLCKRAPDKENNLLDKVKFLLSK
jgi:hypothetical protein